MRIKSNPEFMAYNICIDYGFDIKVSYESFAQIVFFGELLKPNFVKYCRYLNRVDPETLRLFGSR